MSSSRLIRRVEPPQRPDASSLLALAVGVVLVAALMVARHVLIPITLAVLLSFVLGPVVAAQRRIGVPRVVAVLVAVLLALGVVALLGVIIGTQIALLANDIPHYAATIEQKVTTARTFLSHQFEFVTNRLANLQQQAVPAARQALDHGQPPPMPVVVHQPELSPLQLAWTLVMPVVSPLADAGIVFVVAIFILVQREDLRDRLIRLFGSNDLHRTTAALDDAGSRLGRYYLSLLAVNTCFGVVIATGLYFIGVPGPILWGILAGLLRFVPYIGAFGGAVLPLLLAAAVDSGWAKVGEVVALFLAVEPVLGQVIEPLIYGRSTGLSPFSVVISAIFWGWIWGGVGLLLSMPLTLCLVVLGRHIERLQFLEVLLSDEPALSPAEILYQRMLAGDAVSISANAEAALKEQPLLAFADEAVLPALRLAAIDSVRGALTEEQSHRIAELVADLLEEVGDEEPAAPEAEAAPVICVARGGPLDEAACALLAEFLRQRGTASRIVHQEDLTRAAIGRLDLRGARHVVLSAIEGIESRHSLRTVLRRLHGRVGESEIVVGLWAADTVSHEHVPADSTGAVYVTSLQQALEACLAGATPGADPVAPGSVAESP